MADLDDQVTEEIVTPALPAPIAGALAPSPYSFEFTGEDALRLTVHNSVTGVAVAVHYRVAPRTGPTHASAYTFVPATDRSLSRTEFAIQDGWLLNVALFASAGTPKVGQTFCKLEVIRGRGASATVLGVIVQGYVTGAQPLGWPGSPIQSSLDGEGCYRVVVGSVQPDGSEATELVPTGARWELVAVRIVLGTSSAAATRRASLVVDDGINLFMRSPHSITQQADLNVGHHWMQGMAHETAIVSDIGIAGLPIGFVLTAGNRIRTVTANFQAGDHWQAPIMSLREWQEAQG